MDLKEQYAIKPNLLEIRLKELGEVPEVLYEGKLIEAKVSISFDWETLSLSPGHTKIKIVSFDDRQHGVNVELDKKVIEHDYTKEPH